ncbi:hypothetical protein [Corallococcus sp. M7]
MRHIIFMLSASMLVACNKTTDFQLPAPDSEPGPTNPLPAGDVTLKNNYAQAVIVTLQRTAEGTQCSNGNEAERITLEPNQTKTIALKASEKLCYTVGTNMANPVWVGACVARSGQRIGLVQDVRCYRMGPENQQ